MTLVLLVLCVCAGPAAVVLVLLVCETLNLACE